MKIDWHKTLDADLTRRWECFYVGLGELSCITILRKCIPSDRSEVQLLGFCNFLEKFFGTAIYVRSKDEMGNWVTKQLCVKS